MKNMCPTTFQTKPRTTDYVLDSFAPTCWPSPLGVPMVKEILWQAWERSLETALMFGRSCRNTPCSCSTVGPANAKLVANSLPANWTSLAPSAAKCSTLLHNDLTMSLCAWHGCVSTASPPLDTIVRGGLPGVMADSNPLKIAVL